MINLGSELSDCAITLQGIYAASKHAVKGFTDTLRVEVEQVDGAPVSITLVEPTSVDTPLPQHARNYMDREPTLPSPKLDPHQVADAILDADFDAAAVRMEETCEAAPEWCVVMESVSLWWQIALDPQSRRLDAPFERAVARAVDDVQLTIGRDAVDARIGAGVGHQHQALIEHHPHAIGHGLAFGRRSTDYCSTVIVTASRSAASGDHEVRPATIAAFPDFNFKQFRSNAVLRWEYRPGSTLFVVWNSAREEESEDGSFHLVDDVGTLFGREGSNTLLVKLSYWFGL